jgi:hypothetical protein
MSKALFKKLCDKIEGIVGPAEFKSKDFLDEILSHQLPTSDHNHQWRNILSAHEHMTGGFISGVVKVLPLLCAFLEGGCIWIWHYCLRPASTTHTRLSGMSIITGWSMNHSTQLMMWTIIGTNSRCRKLHCIFWGLQGGYQRLYWCTGWMGCENTKAAET